MEVQLRELIDKIKNDGVNAAETKSAEIIKAANAKADEIIDKARKEAAQIISKGKEDAVKSEQSGKEALKQAGRDLVLNLQAKITALFNGIVKKEVVGALNNQVLSEIIVKLIDSWKGGVSDLSVVLSDKQYSDVEKLLTAKLTEQIKKGLEIKPSAHLDAGFLVSVKDGSAYHNFSAEGITEILSEYLNPKLSALLEEGVKGKAEA